MGDEGSTTANDRSHAAQPQSATAPNELIFKYDKSEFLKCEWMEPTQETTAPKPLEQMELHELRFNFEGKLLSGSAAPPTEYSSALHNHGQNPDEPGYTLPELVRLMQSSFPPQVKIAVKTLANVLFQAYQPLAAEGRPPGLEDCFFKFPQQRWNNYLIRDLDLLPKLVVAGYVNQKSVEILVDCLRALSLLLFGDSTSWNDHRTTAEEVTVLPALNVVLDYTPRPFHPEVCAWNSMAPDLRDAFLREGQFRFGEPRPDAESKLSKVFAKALNGELESSSNEQIMAEILGIQGGAELDAAAWRIDPKLALVTKFNLVSKLLNAMERCPKDTKLNVYCTSIITGLVAHFGRPLAAALIKFAPFRDRYDQLITSLPGPTPRTQGSVHVAGAILHLFKHINAHDDVLKETPQFVKMASFIQFVLTRALTSELTDLRIARDIGRSPNERHYRRYAVVALSLPLKRFLGHRFGQITATLLAVAELTMARVKQMTRTAERLHEYLAQNGELLSAVNLAVAQFVTKYPDTKFGQVGNKHAQLAGVLARSAELARILASPALWSAHTQTYLHSLLCLHLEGTAQPGALWPSPKPPDLAVADMLDIMEFVVGRALDKFEVPDALVRMAWHEESIYEGAGVCLCNRALLKRAMDTHVMPFAIANVITETLKQTHSVLEKLGMPEPPAAPAATLDDAVEKLGPALKRLYHELHKTKHNGTRTLYLVKQLPFTDPWISFLEQRHIELSRRKRAPNFVVTPRYERLIRMCPTERPLSITGTWFEPAFEAFIERLAAFSLAGCRFPLVSSVAYKHYLPFQTYANAGIYRPAVEALHKLAKQGGLPPIVEWTPPGYLFAQLAQTLVANEAGEAFAEFGPENYALFQEILFKRLCLGRRPSPTVSHSEDDITDLWARALNEFAPAEGAEPAEGAFEDYFRSPEEMARCCAGLVQAFSAGRHFSPVTIGLLLLFASPHATAECARAVWADAALMLMLGRNLTFDLDSLVVTATQPEGFALGGMRTFAGWHAELGELPLKVLLELSDHGVTHRNPVLFLALAHLRRTADAARIAELRGFVTSELVARILDKLAGPN